MGLRRPEFVKSLKQWATECDQGSTSEMDPNQLTKLDEKFHEAAGTRHKYPQRVNLTKSLSGLATSLNRRRASDLTAAELRKLDRSFHNTINPPAIQPMPKGSKGFIGLWLFALGLASFFGLLWMWPIAERLTSDASAASKHETVRLWGGQQFEATTMTSLLILGAFAAIMGSVTVKIIVFCLRAGYGSLEAGFEPWYLLRPIAAALLGVLFLLALRAGLVALGAESPNSTTKLAPLVVAAGVAGLFTDRVMQRMATLVGVTNPDRPASTQPVPGLPQSSNTEGQ